jgi:protein-disulfide isomerase
MVFLAFFSTAGIGFAQSSDELKALMKEIESIKKDLQEIKSLLGPGRQVAAAPEVLDIALTVANSPFKGDKNAKVMLIEFSDYQCPFCARHFRQTLPQVEKDYIKTGKLRYVFRDYPIENIHPQAFKAAEAAHCAGEQGKYWEMHDRMFANQKAMGLSDLLQHAQVLKLDAANFQRCLDAGKYAAKVRQDIADGEKANVRGTPTFFLGQTDTDGSTIKAVRVIRGAQPYTVFKAAIDGLLAVEKR